MPHQDLDRRSLALHQAIADKLREHPDLLAVARDNLDRWSKTQQRSRPYFEAWRELLGLPLEELLNAVVEDSERMTALRQSSPFAGILEPKERWSTYDAFKLGTHHSGSRRDL
jgi:hypothetical protein